MGNPWENPWEIYDTLQFNSQKAMENGKRPGMLWGFWSDIMGYPWDVPSGKRLQFAIENGLVEIVHLPMNSMVIFHSYIKYM